MKAPKRSTWVGVVLTLAYAVLIVVYILNLVNFPQRYQEEEKNTVHQMEQRISESVNEYALTKQASFDELVENYPLDLLVFEGDQMIYHSSEVLNEANFFGVVSSKAVLYESKGSLSAYDSTYRFWVRMYNFPDDAYLIPFLSKQVSVLGASFVVMTIGYFFIMYSLFKPLHYAKKSLASLQNYDFDAIKPRDDVINQTLSNVSTQIHHAMTAASHRYTDFEKDLEIGRQRLNNTLLVSKSFVHDLKTPIHQQIMMNELVVDGIDESNTPLDVAEMNIKQSQKIMERINEILTVLNQDNLTLEHNLSEFDLVSLTYDTLRYFGQHFAKRNLMIDLDSPDTLVIESNKVILQLLIHNLMSNIGNYATDNSTVSIGLTLDDETVIMTYRNQTLPANLEHMKKSEFLFNVLTDEAHQYSSGNGLFLIKDLSYLANGSYTLHTEDGAVLITIPLPLKGGTNHA
ncbi:sensor histidine kinase [Erysipelothrix piscisicarius]|uniref:histidine kinase n=1 Tax=Erysipelothrix piscisicarius TaxID=2485784 RepID=A0A451ENR0_9FIRM|nr:HAMP domain-containing histidine kinase [Erysipelothrix piscisicarius]AZK43430.1 sensor histidine kinase [Erysipelothrix piscisicarius]